MTTGTDTPSPDPQDTRDEEEIPVLTTGPLESPDMYWLVENGLEPSVGSIEEMFDAPCQGVCEGPYEVGVARDLGLTWVVRFTGKDGKSTYRTFASQLDADLFTTRLMNGEERSTTVRTQPFPRSKS